jgi:aminoglycoside phosphotransferase (APT) family kinase protein
VLAGIVEAVAPGARIVASSTFRGGLSSEMVLVDVELADGGHRRFVVRRARGDRGAISLAGEHRLLEALSARGLPVPRPLLLGASGAGSERPYMVLDYIDGEPRVSADDGTEIARRLADVLVEIHGVDGSAPDFSALPERAATVARVLELGGPVDDSIREGRILEVLRSRWPPRPPRRPSVLHCDLWLGNVLWSGSEIVAVIDWENAHVGDPLADLAITRLELAWSFGREAVAELTRDYASCTGADLTELAIWDLAAARRLAGELSAWAADWSNYGRPDMTSARMRAAWACFVDDALAALGEPLNP